MLTKAEIGKGQIKRKMMLSTEEKLKAKEIHEKALIVDGAQASYFTSEYFEKVRKAGVTATVVTVACNHNLSEAIKLISKWNKKLIYFALFITSSMIITFKFKISNIKLLLTRGCFLCRDPHCKYYKAFNLI